MVGKQACNKFLLHNWKEGWKVLYSVFTLEKLGKAMNYNLENTMTYSLTFLEEKKPKPKQHKSQTKKANKQQ